MSSLMRIVSTALAALLVIGCGSGDPRLAVSGTVKFKGQPLDQGRIEFHPVGGKGTMSGEGILNGRYQIARDKGLAPNTYEVRIFGNATNFGLDSTVGALLPFNPATYKALPAPFGYAPYFKRLGDITDGTSNTLMASECVQGKNDDLRGFTWWAPAAQFTTFYPPNTSAKDITTQNCGPGPVPKNHRPELNLPCEDNGGAWNILAARSLHSGGVNALLCDGSVRFVANAVDIFTWRGLSTIGGGEQLGPF